VIQVLQVGRALAALLVVLFHTTAVFKSDKYWALAPVGDLFSEAGRCGIGFFFVLSGFIIAYAHRSDIGRPGGIRYYLAQRVTRIYPIYWVTTLAVLTVLLAVPSSQGASPPSSAVIFSSLTLIPVAGADANGALLAVAWTLFHELLFYAIFALVIVAPYRGGAVMIAWGLLCAARALGWDTPAALGFVSHPINLLFFFGLAAFFVYSKALLRFPALIGFAGTLVFLAVLLAEPLGYALSYTREIILIGLGAGVGVVGFAWWERTDNRKFGRVSLLLGAASYSLYLVHYPALSGSAKLMFALGLSGVLPPLGMYIVLAMSAMAAGLTCFILVERPLLRLVRQFVAVSRPTNPFSAEDETSGLRGRDADRMRETG
jgi:peptidoglycan/LPS O-acetylase OafA/YrhL